jgi:two-component system chemotaxis response regulator CheB
MDSLPWRALSALPELLRLKPGVKIIIASTLSRKNAEISLNALALGATDYIPKPETNRGVTTSQEFRSELLRKVNAMMPVKARALRRGKPVAGESRTPTPSAAAAQAGTAATYQLRPFSSVKPKILTIGSSTGGPQALAKVIEVISPAIANIPTVITQHMPPTFTAILAEHLARSSGRTAKEGEDGEKLVPGSIYVAPGGQHMTLVKKDGGPVLHVYDGPMINYCKPAVDPLFEGVVKV